MLCTEEKSPIHIILVWIFLPCEKLTQSGLDQKLSAKCSSPQGLNLVHPSTSDFF